MLTGVVRFIQHPGKQKIYPVHMVWVGFILLSVVHFWWLEFNLRIITLWTFEKYLFVIFFAGLYFMICTLLFQDSMEEYKGYRDYFISHRKWFISLLIALFVADVAATLLKGWEHNDMYGPEYPIRAALFIVLSLIGALMSNLEFHTFFAMLAMIYQITFTLRHFATLG